jgi:hypothetical protein
LEADKAGRIPLGVLENSNYIEEKFIFTTTEIFGISLLGQSGGVVESTNRTIWYGAHSIHPNEIRENAKRNTKKQLSE